MTPEPAVSAAPTPTETELAATGLQPTATPLGLQPPAGYGFEPPAEEAGYGFDPAPKRQEVAVPKNYESLAVELAAVTGEDPEALTDEILRGKQYRAIDRAFDKTEATRRQGLIAAAERAATDGDPYAMTTFLDELKRMEGEMADAATYTDKHVAVARQAALASSVSGAARNFSSDEALLDTVDQAARARGMGHTIEQFVAQAQEDVDAASKARPWISVDFLTHAVRTLTYGDPVDLGNIAVTLRRITGKTTADVSTMANELRSMINGAAPEERDAIMAELAKLSPEQRQRLGGWLSEGMTSEQAAIETGFAALGALDGIAAARATAKLAVNVGRVAGKKEAAKVLAKDLLEGTKTSDLTPDELVTASVAHGKLPGMIDPASLSGTSATVQERVLARGRAAWDKISERLRSTGRTDEEVAQAQNDIKAQYDPSVRTDIHSAEFGKGTDVGQRVVVNYQRPDGTLFASREEALAYAQAHGLSGVEPLPATGVVSRAHREALEQVPAAKPRLKSKPADVQEVVSAPPAQQVDLTGMGTAITDNFYARVFESLQAGRKTVAGVKDPILAAARPAFEQGLIKSPEDLRAFANQGKAAAEPKLPAALSGSAPRYKTSELKFDSDLDRAAYIIAQSKKSKQDGEYLKFVMQHTGLDEAGARALGRDLRAKIGREVVDGQMARVAPYAATRAAAPRKALDEEAFYQPMPKEAQEQLKAIIAERQAMLKDLIKSTSRHDPTDAAIAKQEYEQLKDVLKLMKQGRWRELDEAITSHGLDLDLPDAAEMLSDVERGMREARDYMRERFRQSGGPTAFSDKLGKQERQLVEDFRRIFGIPSRDRIFVGYASEAGQYTPNFDDLVAGSNGWYNAPSGLHDYHVIILNDLKTGTRAFEGPARQLQTLVHEFGHYFRESILKEDSPWFSVLKNEWRKRLKTVDDVEFDRFWAELRQPGALVVDPKKGVLLPDRRFSPGFRKWAEDFEEWYAENFAKAAFRLDEPKSAIERMFAAAADATRAAYEYIAHVLGYDTSKANKFVEEHLREHMDLVKRGVEQNKKDLDFTDLDFTEIDAAPMPDMAAEEIGTDGWVLRQTLDVPYSYESVGKYTDADIASMPWLAVDPKHAASEFAVEQRVVGVHAEDKTRRALLDMVKEAWAPLSSKSRAKVFNVLTEGDAYSNLNGTVGKEFNGTELLAKGLTEAEMEAYFTTRQARNMTHTLRDSEMVRDLVASGHMNTGFTVVEDGVGRYINTPGRLVQPADVINKVIYDARTGTGRRMDGNALADLIEEGSYVIRLREPQVINGKTYQHIIGSPDVVRQTNITTVLPYRPGEFARIYTDEYFARAIRTTEVDGAVSEVDSVIRTARSEKEATAYAKSMNDAVAYMRAFRAGEVSARTPETMIGKLIGGHTDPTTFIRQFDNGDFEGVRFDYKFTRTKDEYLNLFTSRSLAERPFTGTRGGRIYSVDPQHSNTLDVMQSLEAEITNVSRVANISEWRETQIRRWMNTFGHMITDRTGDDVADFYRLGENGFKFAKVGQNERFAERTHEYIMRQLGVRTAEEKMYQNWTREVSERWLNAEKGTVVNTVGAWIRSAAPLDFLRSVNFNLVLGMFNPAQLLVQANGMATAVLLSPLHGLAAAKTYPLLRLALMSDNPATWRTVGKFNSLTDMGLSSAGEFEDLVRAVRRSGIIDNLNSTALHNMESGKLGIVTGLSGKALAAGRIPFNRGEELSRLVSFDVARREWIKKNVGRDWTSDAALKEIVVRMDDLTQNMTRANQAAWQKGAASIPFQFLQYNIKLASNLVTSTATGLKRVGGAKIPYRGFTAGESARLMAGHLVLYGAAGYGATQFMDEILGAQLTDSMTPEQKTYVAEGLIAGFIATLTSDEKGEGGTHIAVGSRLGSFDFYTRMADALFSSDTSLWDAILGPSKMTGRRLGAAADVIALWQAGAMETPDAVLEGVGAIAVEEISTLRNATRAYLYYQNSGVMINSKGTPIAKLDKGEMLAQALGFQSSQALDTYNLIAEKSARSQALNEIADLMYKLQREEIQATLRKDYETAEKKRKARTFLVPKNAGDAIEVQRRIKDHLYPGDTEFQHLMGEYLMKGFSPQNSNPFTVTGKPGSYLTPTPGGPGETYGR